MSMHFRQRTVASTVRCSGIGLHSGKKVRLAIKPAPVNHGIKFRRMDLPDRPSVSAHFNLVVDTSLATVIGNEGFIVSTIEHIMACFAGLSIDNVLIEMDSYEVPIMDGSAYPFTALIKAAGIKEQKGLRYFFVIKEPIELKEGNKSVALYPCSTSKITCTIEFDHPMINKQSYSLDLSEKAFEDEICRARTFGFLHEIEYMKKYGFARGGSLENAVVIDKQAILNKDGLRYQDEFVRHKILDCIGDFSLLGMPILGHIVAIKSGHSFHHAFLKEFFAQRNLWETRPINEMKPINRFESKSLVIL
ncbi:MAG TPA: UDP-3-O-acyl-N-acetylglucosamine deacetylase [Desulfobacterales bacterium]|nr:UDP-3-O-acyl-N-acetylglucosamine deacetylase [Desulfobacterales bacterium]